MRKKIKKISEIASLISLSIGTIMLIFAMVFQGLGNEIWRNVTSSSGVFLLFGIFTMLLSDWLRKS